MQTPCDQNEREQALDTSRSFIVQAPAGSGKTELLTQRFLALLANAKVPEEIIAITFTRKAAAEMRNRIVETLQIAAEPASPTTQYNPRGLELAKKVLARDRITKWELLANPNRLRIQTIDAFCANLTRQMPLLSQFGAQPAIVDDSYWLYKQTAQTILAGLESNAPWGDALAILLLHLDNDHRKVEKLLSEMLAKRDQWLPHIASSSQKENLRSILEQGLQQAVTETLLILANSIPKELANQLFNIAELAAGQIKRFADQPFIETNESGSLDQLEQEKKSWLGLAQLLLTKEGEWRKQLTKREGFFSPTESKNNDEKKFRSDLKIRMQELLNDVMEYENFKEHLLSLRLLPPSHYPDSQWEVLTALLEILPVLVAQLRVLFQEQAVVDYIEISHSALVALGEPQDPTDLALTLDYQIQHILVDEFQDTSTTQFRLLEQLTAGWQQEDGRTLFLVGDPMQSIYRFRKAEVGLFLQACETGIGNVHLEPLTLRTNFRSTAKIVTWNNLIFQELFPKQTNRGAGAIPFHTSDPFDSDDAQETVYIHGLVDENNAEAKFICKLIQEILITKPKTSIAILVRARRHLLDILPALQVANISYRATEIETLAERSVIQDLFALTRALLHPADRIAWLAILRAPWCGLTLHDLTLVTGNDHTITLWERLMELDFEQFSASTKITLKRVVAVLNQSIKNRRRVQLAAWVQGTWLALGGPASLQTDADLEDSKVFFKLLESLQIGEDIPDLAQLERKIDLLYAAPQTGAHIQVDVMTIHKAKGLEFDTVILPGLSSPLPTDNPQLLFCTERPNLQNNTDLLLAPIKASADELDPIYNYLRCEEKKRAEYETARLLYVAASRAKKSLHLIALLTKDVASFEIKKPVKNSLLAQLWPILGENVLTNIRAQELSLQNDIPLQTSKLRRLTSTWKLPPLPSGIVPNFMLQSTPSTKKNNYYLWKHYSIRAVGTVIHQLLCQIAKDGLNTWNDDTITARKTYFATLLTRQGVITEELPQSITLVENALRYTIQDPRGRWILDPKHQSAKSEYPLSATINNEIKHVIIDRTFIDEQGLRWIIDYKSVAYDGTDLESFLNRETETYRLQLEDYAAIIQSIEPLHPIRLGLYFPLLKAWREWEFKEGPI